MTEVCEVIVRRYGRMARCQNAARRGRCAVHRYSSAEGTGRTQPDFERLYGALSRRRDELAAGGPAALKAADELEMAEFALECATDVRHVLQPRPRSGVDDAVAVMVAISTLLNVASEYAIPEGDRAVMREVAHRGREALDRMRGRRGP